MKKTDRAGESWKKKKPNPNKKKSERLKEFAAILARTSKICLDMLFCTVKISGSLSEKGAILEKGQCVFT